MSFTLECNVVKLHVHSIVTKLGSETRLNLFFGDYKEQQNPSTILSLIAPQSDYCFHGKIVDVVCLASSL